MGFIQGQSVTTPYKGSQDIFKIPAKTAKMFCIMLVSTAFTHLAQLRMQVAAVQRQYQRDAVDFFFNNAEKVPPVHSGSENMPNFL